MAETLPPEMGLETNVGEFPLFFGMSYKNPRYFDEMDINSPLTKTYEKLGETWHDCGLLAEALGGNEQSHATVYRAYVFANEVIDLISPFENFSNLGRYQYYVGRFGNPGEKMRDDAEDYLRDRPSVNNFLETYKHNIDITDDWADLAKTVSTIVFMLREKDMSETYIKSLSANKAAETDISE